MPQVISGVGPRLQPARISTADETRGPHHRRRALDPSMASLPPRQVRRHSDDGWQLARPFLLRRRAERVLRGLAHLFLPPPPAPQLTQALEDAIVDQMLRLLMYMHPMTRLGMRVALTVVDWAPRWRLVSWRRLHHLDRSRAEDLLDRLGHSRIPIIRTLVFVVRGLILSVYFDQDTVQEAMGYRPAPWIESRIALRRRLLDGDRPQATDFVESSDRVRPSREVVA